MREFIATLGGCVALAGWVPASAFDPLLAERSVSSTPSANIFDGGACSPRAVPTPVHLQDVVEWALCSDPKTRSAWAEVKIQAAQVGQRRAAFLPTVTANWQGTRDIANDRVSDQPRFESNSVTNMQNITASLNWVLYDFGGRTAGLRSATEMLAAAQANQHALLQTTFANVGKHFYAAQAAYGELRSATEIEETARSSVAAATARVSKGIAAISDQLQAQSAHAEAVIHRTKAAIALRSALGMLASDMNLLPSASIVLPDVTDGVEPNRMFTESVDALIQAALGDSPRVRAAEANVRAARANAVRVGSEGAPRLSLIGQYNFNNRPASLQTGSPVLPAMHRAWYVGLQLTIPIFEGFLRSYQVKQANAQTEQQSESLAAARRQVGLDVWNDYHAVKGATANLRQSAALLELSQQAYDVALHRYRSGVGEVLELLNSQSALARAKQQRIQAQTEWKIARLQLASSLGKLDMASLDGAEVSRGPAFGVKNTETALLP
ncbi:MAG TPA: TolC family protein [Trinickia sp.]